MIAIDERLIFPLILWMRDYVYVAREALELCAHVRSEYKRYENCGEWERSCLMAGDGGLWRVEGWRRIRPMGGVRGVMLYAMGSVFAAPVLGTHKKTSLSDYKALAIEALNCRVRYDVDGGEVAHALGVDIESANSYDDVVNVLTKLG